MSALSKCFKTCRTLGKKTNRLRRWDFWRNNFNPKIQQSIIKKKKIVSTKTTIPSKKTFCNLKKNASTQLNCFQWLVMKGTLPAFRYPFWDWTLYITLTCSCGVLYALHGNNILRTTVHRLSIGGYMNKLNINTSYLLSVDELNKKQPISDK